MLAMPTCVYIFTCKNTLCILERNSNHAYGLQVLVIGGGDGGAIREALKHPEVEEVHICEIDEVNEEIVIDTVQYICYTLCRPSLMWLNDFSLKWLLAITPLKYLYILKMESST